MVSARKRQANRRNSLKSTGPRTAAGKAISSRNRITHGLFCRSLVLPGESLAEMRLLRHQLIYALRPQDYMELMLVDRIVAAQWKLNRLQQAEHAQYVAQTQSLKEQARIKAQQMNEALESDNFDEIERVMEEEEYFARQKQFVELAGRDRLPAAAVLAASFNRDDSVLERMALYEQRLERSMMRAHDKLRAMRRNVQPKDLPHSPFLPGLEQIEECCREMDQDKAGQEETPPDAEQKMEFEATESAAEAQVEAVPEVVQAAEGEELNHQATKDTKPLSSDPRSDANGSQQGEGVERLLRDLRNFAVNTSSSDTEARKPGELHHDPTRDL